MGTPLAVTDTATDGEIPNLSKIPGAQICSMLGIERDLHMKPLPTGTTVLNVSFSTSKTPTARLRAFKDALSNNNGIFLNALWTEPNSMHLQAILPNLQQAYSAAYAIKTSCPDTAVAASPDPCGIMTYKGNLICVGDGFESASEAIRYAQSDKTTLTLKQNSLITNEPLQPTGPKRQDTLVNRSTPQSVAHAKTLQPLDSNLPRKGTMIKIQLAKNDTGNSIEQTKKIIKFIEAVYGEKTVISSHGLIAFIFVAEERIGEVISRMSSMQHLLQDASICVDVADCKFVDAGDSVSLMQSQSIVDISHMNMCGTWGTSDRFVKTIHHERNRANVAVTFGRTSGQFVKIEKIEPVHFEATVGGPRKTIGRQQELQTIRTNLENLERRGKANITVITGEAGVGKTRLASEAIREAHEHNVASVYYKTPEDGKNTPAAGVKKLIEGILKTKPELLERFRDLRFFTEGRVPEGFREEYGTAVQALGTKEFLSKRFYELMEECKKSPIQIILDDLQWFDSVSVEIIKTWLSRVDERSNIQIVLMAREGEEQLPEDFEKILAKKQNLTSKISLKRLDYGKNPEFLEDYIRHSLPEHWESAAIPESFVREIAEVSQGLPIVITEILSLLVEKGDIKYRGGTLIIKSDAVKELAQEDIGITLSSVLQARFERLTDQEKRTVDYLVALGNVNYEIFVNLLRYLGENPQAVEKALVGLRKKGILRFEPFGFSHDLLRRERESQMEGHDGKLSCIAAQCYPVLKTAASRYPQAITPVFLFELLMKASKRPEALTPEQRKTTATSIMPELCEASDFSINKNENMLAFQLIKRFVERIVASNETPLGRQLQSVSDKILEGKDIQTQATLAPVLFRAFCNGAQACVRMGQPAKATAFLDAIDHLAGKAPQAQLRTGIAGLHYFHLQTDAAYAARNRERFIHAKGEFQRAIELSDSQNDPNIRFFKCEATLLDVRLCNDPQQAYRISSGTKAELNKLATEADKCGNHKLAIAARALSMDITRTVLQKMFLALKNKIKGVDDESLFMQQIKGDDLVELDNLERQFLLIKTDYENNPGLVRDPQAYGYLFDMIARIQYLRGLSENSNSTIENGIRTCTNMNLMEIVSRLHKLKGDIRTASAIKHNPSDAKMWNADILEQAIDEYTQGIAEIERVIEDKTTRKDAGEEIPPSDDELYKTLNALNRGWAFALLTLAKTSSGRFERLEATEEFTGMGTRLQAQWISMCNALDERRINLGQNIDPSNEQDYLKELAHAGLLVEASLDPRLETNLPMPKNIELKDILAEIEFLKKQRADIKLHPKNYSDSDKTLIALRWKGINAWKHIFRQLIPESNAYEVEEFTTD